MLLLIVMINISWLRWGPLGQGMDGYLLTTLIFYFKLLQTISKLNHKGKILACTSILIKSLFSTSLIRSVLLYIHHLRLMKNGQITNDKLL